ncbi:MAG: GHKL domain-containing protein [Thermotogae bacterium]|nr:GHKL domain-containing protein [Thermotogota bacterium]
MFKFMIVGSFITAVIVLAVSVKYAMEKGIKKNQNILYFVSSTIPWYIGALVFSYTLSERYVYMGYPFLLSFVLFNSLAVLYLYSSIFKEHWLLFYIFPSTIVKSGILLGFILQLPRDLNGLITYCFLAYAVEMLLPLMRIFENRDVLSFRTRVIASHFSLLDLSLLGSVLTFMLMFNFSSIREFTLALSSIFLAFITVIFLRFVYATDLPRLKIILVSDVLYYLVTAMITTLGFIIIFQINLYLMKLFSTFKSFWIDFSLVMILILLIQPIVGRIQRQLEIIFRKGHVRTRNMFKTFTKSLTRMTSIEQIVGAAQNFLINLFEDIDIRIFLRKSSDMGFMEVGGDDLTSIELTKNTVEYLVKAHDVVSITELPQLAFLENKYALLIPLVTENMLMGFIVLEKKSQKKHLSYDDVEILRIFENNLTVALIRANEAQRMREMDMKEMQMEKLSALGKLAAGLAHEVRNPLNIVYTSTETILEREKNLNPQSQELLGFIREEIERIDNMLSTFLKYSKPKVPVYKPVDIGELIRKVTTLLNQQVRGKNIMIVTNTLDSGDDLIVMGDSSQLFQVLLNLGTNALESLDDRGKISFDAWEGNEHVYIRISDTGKGIPKKVKSRVFEPFFTTKENGTGMGLFIVHEIVRSHGGRIECKSEKKKTVFTVTLPKGEK